MMFVLTALANLTIFALVLLGSFIVAFFMLLWFRHGWRWAWNQMFTRPWRAAIMRTEAKRAFKEGMNKAPIPYLHLPNEVKIKDPDAIRSIEHPSGQPFHMYEGVYVFPDEEEKGDEDGVSKSS